MSSVEMQDVDFLVLSEDYSRFLLHDGTILKAKIVLKKIFFTPLKTPEGYPMNTAFDSINIVVSIVPQSLKRAPSNEPFNPQQDKGTEIKFEEQETKLQEYMTTNGFKISIRPVLTKVFKYDIYNQVGEPIYNVILQAITNIDKLETTAT
ncbi:MAG: hypothetical protein WBP64_17935 [Nitrososphaeraceae archaeon]